MTPIGRGQRELIIGDRQTGKTAIAIDTIINQKANWESGDPARQVTLHLRGDRPEGLDDRPGAPVAGGRGRDGVHHHRRRARPPTRPATSTSRPTPARRSASTGCTQGKHVLIIFDDLSKQAEAYRAISLLLRRPPGREAYPGDVFYLHSRLLERCAKLSEGSGRRVADRPADHRDQGQRHLGLHPDQRHLDHRRADLPGDRPVQLRASGPAINVGRSVSRVGGDAQIKAMKKVAGGLQAGPVAVPRPGGVRRVRLRPGRGVPRPAGPRRAAGRAAQAAAVQPVPGGAAGGRRSGRAPRATSTTCRSRTSAGSRPSSWTTSQREHAGHLRRDPGDRRPVRRHRHRAQGRDRGVPARLRDQPAASCWSRTSRPSRSRRRRSATRR